MFNRILILTIPLFILSQCVFASTEADLETHYGPRLYGASIDVRHAFRDSTGKSWENSTRTERKLFLFEWQKNLEISKKEQFKIDRDKERAQRNLNREKEAKKRAKEKKMSNDAKAKANELRAKAADQRRYNKLLKNNNNRINKLKRSDKR